MTMGQPGGPGVTIEGADSGAAAEAAAKANEHLAQAHDAAVAAAKRSAAQHSELRGVLDNASVGASKLSDVLTNTTGRFSAALNPLMNMANAMKGMTQATTAQASAFGLAGTFLLGYKEKLDFSSVNQNPLNGFVEQFNLLNNVITQSGPNSSMAQQALSGLGNTLTSMGRPAAEVKNMMSQTTDVFLNYAKQVMSSADSVYKMRDGQLALAAETGTLGDFYKRAGTDLQNINNMLQSNTVALVNTAAQTGLTTDQVGKFYTQFSKIPGALEATAVGFKNPSDRIGMFSGLLLQAQGNGRDFNEVIKEATTLFYDFGIAGQDALTAIGRVSEVSERTGAPLDKLKETLFQSANALNRYADAGPAAGRQFDALANNAQRYYNVLTAGGMSSTNALGAINQMTTAMSGLGLAQKAFLSQQTGGPGGMMGAFQIEKMLKDGDTAGVFDKMRESLMKQTGPLVGLDEATQSQEGANQMTKQIALLRQGPLGEMAKSDQDAYRLIEALKNNDRSQFKPELSQTVVQDQMRRGDMLRQQTRTPLTDMQTMLSSMTFKVDFANADTLQRAFVQRPGTTVENTAQGRAMRNSLGAGPNLERRPNNTGENVANGARAAAAVIPDLLPNMMRAGAGLLTQFGTDSKNEPKGLTNEELTANLARNQYTPPGAQVANAPRGTANPEDQAAAQQANGMQRGNAAAQQEPISVDLKFGAYCLKCGREDVQTDTLKSMSPQAASSNRR